MNVPVPDPLLDGRDGLATLTFDRPDSRVNLLTGAAIDELAVLEPAAALLSPQPFCSA